MYFVRLTIEFVKEAQHYKIKFPRFADITPTPPGLTCVERRPEKDLFIIFSAALP